MDGKRQGRFLGLPYDWRRPTASRAKSRLWNTDEPRLFVPKSYGWGYTINLGAVVNWLRRLR